MYDVVVCLPTDTVPDDLDGSGDLKGGGGNCGCASAGDGQDAALAAMLVGLGVVTLRRRWG